MIRIMKKDKRIYKKKKLSRSEEKELKLKESYTKRAKNEYDLYLTKAEENNNENINNLKTSGSNVETCTYEESYNVNNEKISFPFPEENAYSQILTTNNQIYNMLNEIQYQNQVLEYLLFLSLQVSNMIKLNNL